jgi:hypothetical protein
LISAYRWEHITIAAGLLIDFTNYHNKAERSASRLERELVEDVELVPSATELLKSISSIVAIDGKLDSRKSVV